MAARTTATQDRSFIRVEAESHGERQDDSAGDDQDIERDEAAEGGGEIPEPRVREMEVRINRIPEQWGPRSMRRGARTSSRGSTSNSGPRRKSGSRRRSRSRSARRRSTPRTRVQQGARRGAGTPPRRGGRPRSPSHRRAGARSSPGRRATSPTGRTTTPVRRSRARPSSRERAGARSSPVRATTPVRRTRRRSRSTGRSARSRSGAGRRSPRSPPTKRRRSKSSDRSRGSRRRSSDRARRGRARSSSKGKKSSRSASKKESSSQMIKDLTLTVKKLERQQQLGAHTFTNSGIEKQAEFIREVGNWVEDSLKTKLEAELGEVPKELKKVVETGEKLLAERLHLLRIADRFGWSAVQEFTSIELARTDSEEKKLKKIMKSNEAKLEKQREAKKFKPKHSFFHQKKFGSFSHNYSQGNGGGSNTDHRYGSYKSQRAIIISKPTSGGLKGARSLRRKTTSSVSAAKVLGTWPGTAEFRIPGEGEEEDEAVSPVGTVVPDFIVNKHDSGSLDYFEGIKYPGLGDDEYVDGWDGIAVEEVEKDIKVVDSLKGKVDVWKEYGAGKMVLQILSNGLKLNFTGKAPTVYEEVNNKSFINNEEFGIEEIKKLLANGVVEEVSRKEVVCINPMSIASNKKGKKRLCIDLSRHVNKVCDAKKFTIESVKDFTKTVKKGSWCWYYDLKSAFHHITVRDKHRKFLGFKATVDGTVKIFIFKAMPFGYRDASRILTKVMRTAICRWRKAGLPSFIHIDDGLGFKATKEEATVAADMVRKDLEVLGLVTSRDKCQWEPVQEFVWCGFDWDTRNFTVSVTREKRDRIKTMAKELWGQEWVSAREMAGLTGLIISCAPAVGRAARFYTRFSVRWCQDVVDEHSWGARSKLSDEVRGELRFWELRMEDHCSQLIRHSAGVTEVYVCSDAGGHLIGGTVTINGKEQVQKRFQVSLEEWEKEYSSTYRELRSIEHALTLVGPELRGKSIRYGNDNMAACKVVEFGSTKADCHMVAVRIARLVEVFKLELVMVWRRRNTEEITLCDKLSKDFDLSEYRLSQESFDALNEEFGPWEVDWFASDWSRRLERFSSRYWTIGGEAPDAFSQKWDQDAGYFHPPLPDLARVLEKVETEGARGAILVPDWPGSETDSIMIQAGGMVELMGVRGVVFESPEWRTDDKFRGVSAFGMRIYRIK